MGRGQRDRKANKGRPAFNAESTTGGGHGTEETAAEGGYIRPVRVVTLYPRFELGRIVATTSADAAMKRLGIDPARLLGRHVCGDWGDLRSDEDWAENERALGSGARLLSVYIVEGTKFWVITDAATTACFDCHDFYGGEPNPECAFCAGTTWGTDEHRLTTTILLPEDY